MIRFLNWAGVVGFAGCVAGVAATFAGPAGGDALLVPTARYPHDARAFTQGLAWHDGVLYEGTGREGTSVLRTIDLATGSTTAYRKLDARLFGEGVAVHGDEIFQLTWKSGRAYVYDRATLDYKRQFRYRGEGWGLASDGTHLVMSDGSSVLRFLDPATFETVRRVRVRDGRTPVENLNELEVVDGEVFANVWYDRRIARIDPATGTVTGWLDGSELVRRAGVTDREHVLNGIAFDPENRRLLLTGKYWPAVFEVPWPEGS